MTATIADQTTTHVSCSCPFCGSTVLIEIPLAEMAQYVAGVHAQEAFRSLTADQRERIVSGICPKCWDETFGDAE